MHQDVNHLPQKASPVLVKQASRLVLHYVPTRLSRIILEHINKIKFYTSTKEEEHRYHLVNELHDEVLARMADS